MTTDTPSPYALWKQAKGDNDEYIRLMKEHGHLVEDHPEDLMPGFYKMPFETQVRFAVWVPGRGWLTVRRGITACNLSGRSRTISELDMLLLEVKTGYRAMRRRLAKDGIRGEDED